MINLMKKIILSFIIYNILVLLYISSITILCIYDVLDFIKISLGSRT